MVMVGGKEEVIVERAYARVGLLGNPSDIYFGCTLALAVKQFEACVTLVPNAEASDPRVRVVPNLKLDLLEHCDIAALQANLQDRGYHGGARLLLALLKVFADECQQRGIELFHREEKEEEKKDDDSGSGGRNSAASLGGSRGFSLSYESNVPFQVGLSGSSAIICAALRCLVRYYGVKERLVKAMLPNLMLRAENELGIVAGYMDRVIQVYGGLVYMDFDKEHFEKAGHGMYQQLDPKNLPEELYLMFQREDRKHKVKASGDSGRIHSTVRERWLRGDADVHRAMQEFRSIAQEGKDLLLQRNKDKQARSQFAALMRKNFALRRSLFGDQALGESNLEMIRVAESCGGAAKFTGSGGAVVVYCPGGQLEIQNLQEECEKRNFAFMKIEVAGQTEW